MNMNYEAIKRIAKESKLSYKKLIVLAPQNDPFYAGRSRKEAVTVCQNTGVLV